MINAKEKVLDRIEQSFIIFKDNFINLFFPIFIFNFLFTIVIFNIFSSVFNYFNPVDYTNLNSGSIFGVSTIIYITFLIAGFLIFSILSIGISLGLLKTIKDGYNGENIILETNIKYGFLNILEAFKTYWYMFSYTLLIPSLLFILGGIFIIIAYFIKEYSSFNGIGIFLISISCIISIFYIGYRGLKISFSLMSAISKNSFTKDNFLFSVRITDNNWMRILGNIILVGIFAGLVSSTFSYFISMIGNIGSNINYSAILNNPTQEDLINILKSYSDFNIFKLIASSLKLVITTLTTVFTLVFMFVLFKRLEAESSENENVTLKEIIETDRKENTIIEY